MLIGFVHEPIVTHDPRLAQTGLKFELRLSAESPESADFGQSTKGWCHLPSLPRT